ncbi:uncharacterized protein N7496_003412 [Penicillium cataractarum]|uniref:Uncharacterized protein n=1 Tax=Penicillium cataractarum TaxID=2100454 RepID=A0A9W9SNJ2_9EURO|nr:uncharacterized protein N7496_003412 [Penicillium cataractarum]KAJ5380984.1 hypothetical protein N7496_003412 [Penicillium cataractarum]
MAIGEKVDMYWAFNSYVEWPEAIDDLLDAGFEPNEYSFRQAIVQGQIQTLKRILAKRKNYRICHCFLEAASAKDPACSFENLEVFEFLADLVSKRRKELQNIAEATLPKEMLSHLLIRADTLIGYRAGETVQLLSSHGVDVEFEDEYGYLIYNQVHGRTAFAEVLWSFGFKDVDETDSEGYTCLMLTPAVSTATRLEFAHWLKGKGADLDRKRIDQPAMFYVAYGVGQLIMHDAVCYHRAHSPSHVAFPDSNFGDSESWGMVNDILHRSYRDSCACKCSDAGCCSTTRFVHGLALNKLPPKRRMEVISKLGDISTQRSVTANPSALIRALTFDTLSLPHTCNHSTDIDDEILARETQNETKGSVQLLDDLLDEFHQMYERSDSTLFEFLQGHWATRMCEVCGEEVVIDEDNEEEFVDALEEVTP